MLSLPNPFPAENRLLLAAKNATSQLDKREDMENRREIAGHIEAIIECVSGNVAIFFTSYAMMNQYSSICKKAARHARKKLYLEPRSAEEVPQVLDDFFACGTKKGAVLLGVSGGKLAEGIDYKGEALNGVAVVGLPLAVYNDIQREINGYYVRKYGREKGMLIAYTLPAINRGMQAGGRVIRDQSERGVILFCDRRFNDGSRAGVRRYLPEWIQSELVTTDAAGSRRIIEEKQRE
jgi:DNA excision repair protein ERCC-2